VRPPRRPDRLDLTLGLLYLAAALGEQIAFDEWGTAPLAVQVIVTVLVTAALTKARSSPVFAGLLYAAMLGGGSLLWEPAEVFMLGLSVVAMPFLLSLRLRGWSLAATMVLVCAALAVHDVADTSINGGDVVVDQFWPLLGLAAGLAVARRQRRVDHVTRLAGDIAELAVVEERARIARELHDVVAHGMSVMVVQADAARHGLPESDQATREALVAIETIGRESLREMRRLLGLLGDDEAARDLAPQPRLTDLPELARSVTAAGLPVAIDMIGSPVSLSPGTELAAYRVVQEALTNALRHSGARRADVEVSFEPRELVLSVRDDGVGSAADMGRGLLGMQERIRFFGGTLAIQQQDGFQVVARLPIESRP
jgi:signal transduction histidine kinase